MPPTGSLRDLAAEQAGGDDRQDSEKQQACSRKAFGIEGQILHGRSFIAKALTALEGAGNRRTFPLKNENEGEKDPSGRVRGNIPCLC